MDFCRALRASINGVLAAAEETSWTSTTYLDPGPALDGV